ncbi:MAG: branched-chain amino acid transport system ATP-binding protein livF, partial [Actinomycetota bacterium]
MSADLKGRRREPLRAREPEVTEVLPIEEATAAVPATATSAAPDANTQRMFRSPIAILREVREVAGPVGMLPLWILLGVSAAERFDFTAYGVLGPEIRRAFSLTNSEYQAIAGLAAIAPLLLAVPIGAWADRTNRVRLARWGALLWAVTCIGTGLAPAIIVFTLFRIAGGSGQTVNQPVHPSLLSDYYPP